MSEQRYRTIVADPPWEYGGFAGSVGYGGNFAGQPERARVQVKPLPYPSLTLTQIAALPVPDLAERDAWLFLWTTNRYLFDAHRIPGGWGFAYSQTLVWRKTSNVPPFGGTFGPNHAEFLLACRRGKPQIVKRWPASVIEAPKPNQGHSRKPDVFVDLIEGSTRGPYCELFARRARFGSSRFARGQRNLMGYNLHARCNRHAESAFISRGNEVASIRLFMARHADRLCAVEWAVDNTCSTPYWVDQESDLYLPDDAVDGLPELETRRASTAFTPAVPSTAGSRTPSTLPPPQSPMPEHPR